MMRTLTITVTLLSIASAALSQTVVPDHFVPTSPVAAPGQVSPQTGGDSAERRRLLDTMFEAMLANQKPSTPGRVAISTYVYDADGNVPSMAFNSRAGDFTLYVYSRRSICQQISASEELPADAGFGWRVSVHPISTQVAGIATTPSQDGRVVVARPLVSIEAQVDWQRMWDAGKSVTGPSGTSRLTLRPGDRVPLDSISAAVVPDGCTGTAMTLYVSPAQEGVSGSGGGARTGGARGGAAGRGVGAGRPVEPGAGSSGSGGGFGGSGAGGAGGGTGGGRSGRGGAGAVSPRPIDGSVSASSRGGSSSFNTGVGPSAGGGASGGGTGAGGCRPGDRPPPNGIQVEAPDGQCTHVYTTFDSPTLTTVNAEIWLVHTLPTGTEEVQHQKIQTRPFDGKFTFAPVTVEGLEGRFGVEVSGFVQAQKRADGGESIAIGTVRKLTAAVPPPRALSASSRAIRMPAEGEVVSAEIPDCWGCNRFAGHKFALRIRIVR